jgi:hypothetical protein
MAIARGYRSLRIGFDHERAHPAPGCEQGECSGNAGASYPSLAEHHDDAVPQEAVY